MNVACFRPPDIVLQMLAIGIKNVHNFPFPSKPPLQSLLRAYSLLSHLGAVSSDDDGGKTVTALGKLMTKLPIG